jgi:hypothetical protein
MYIYIGEYSSVYTGEYCTVYMYRGQCTVDIGLQSLYMVEYCTVYTYEKSVQRLDVGVLYWCMHRKIPHSIRM